MFGALPARSWLSLYVILIGYRAFIKNELKRHWVVHTQLTFRWNRLKQVYRYATESLHVRFCDNTTRRQHTIQKLHKMSYLSAYLKSYSTRPIVSPKLPASVINLDFLKIAHKNRDTSPTLAGGGPKKAILGCLHSTPIILLYNACRVSSHSAFLIRNIIYKLNVGRSRVPSLRLLKDTDLLTTPRMSLSSQEQSIHSMKKKTI